jgi:hypothetical protein
VTIDLRQAALAVVEAHEAVRDALNGMGHDGEPHDDALAPERDPRAEFYIIDQVGDCAACGGARYGAEMTENAAFGQLRAALGLEVRPWESAS